MARLVGVVRRVALGRSNREIARELFLGPRTVEMHVGADPHQRVTTVGGGEPAGVGPARVASM